MIILTKLDGSSILVNLDSIKYVESIPDTRVVFLNGDSLIVKETPIEIQSKSVSFWALVNQQSDSEKNS